MVIENDFKSFTAETFNQLVRAHVFIIMDHILTAWLPNKETTAGEFDAVLYLCNEAIMLVYKWISVFSEYYECYLESLQYPNLYLVSLKHAIPSASPEFSELLKLLFGLIKRSSHTFEAVDRELRERGYASSKSSYRCNEFQKRNIGIFQDCKGFEAVIKLFTTTKADYPISLMTDLLEPLVGALCSISPNEFADLNTNNYLKEILNITRKRLNVLTDRDIKEMDIYSLEKLFYILNVLKTEPKEPSGLMLSIAIQLIKSSYIKQRLLGARLIAEAIPKPKNDSQYAEDKDFIKVMEDYQLLDIILGENAHPEILRKLQDIFTFLLINNKLSSKHIEMLWKCANEKHEDTMRICLAIIENITKRMQYSQIQELFTFIQVGTFQSEILIKFLEIYTLNVLDMCIMKEGKKSTAYKQKAESMKYKLFDLDLFWNLLFDSQLLPPKLKTQAMGALLRIVEKYSLLAEEYVIKAADAIRANQMVAYSMLLLKNISSGKDKIGKKIESIIKEYSIINNILNNCEVYHMKVKDSKELDSVSGLVFDEQAKLYVEFIEYCIMKGSVTLSKEQFDILWKCYIEHSFNQAHADILFTSMMKQGRIANVNRRFLLATDEVSIAIFEDLLCNPSIAITKLTPCGFTCLREYMAWVNSIDKAKKLSLEMYKGLHVLWDITFKSEELKEKAKEFLVNFIESVWNKTKRGETTEKILSTVLDYANNSQQTETALTMINDIIDKVECLKYEEVGDEYFNSPLLYFDLLSLKDESTMTLTINEKMRFSNLKLLLSNVLKVHKSKIVLRDYATRTEFAPDYNCLLTTLKRKTEGKLCYSISKVKFPLKETPRYILANSKLFDRLKSLLNSKKESIINNTWSLILSLPLNEAMESMLKNINSMKVPKSSKERIKEWEAYLNIQKDPSSLVYCLHVINTLITKGNTKKEYTKSFIEKGGVAFVLSIFNSKANVKCLEYCIRILTIYITPEYYNEVFEESEGGIKFWDETIHLLESSTDKDLLEVCYKAHYAMIAVNKDFIDKIINKEYIRILEVNLLNNDNNEIRICTAQHIKSILLMLDKAEEIQKTLMNTLMIDFFTRALEESKNPESYFGLMTELIVSIKNNMIGEV